MGINLRLSAGPNGTRNIYALTRDLVANYGADPTGSTGITSALNSFHTEGVAASGKVLLTVPLGSFVLDSSTGGVQTFTSGISDLTIRGAGSSTTITRNSTGPQLILGAEGLNFDNLHHALVGTVVAGASSVTLVDATKVSRFSVNQWCLMAGVDLQGFGDPFNNHFFEYVKILSIVGSTIFFDRNLKYSYKSTWPVYNDGSSYATGGGMTQGGAATLYALKSIFDTNVLIQDLTMAPGSGLVDPLAQFCGRNVESRNMTFNWTTAIYPTVAYSATFTNPNTNGEIEHDKSIDTLNIVGGYVHKHFFQSSSVNLCQISGGHLTDFLAGTPKSLICTSSTLTRFMMAPGGYGVTESIQINNCSLGSFEIGGGAAWSISGQSYTMSGGVIQAPRANGPLQWAVPGTWIRLLSSTGTIGFAHVTDISADASFTYVTTNLAGGFPTGTVSITVHPCASWSGLSNTGCVEALEHSMSYAQNKPVFSYINRTYDKALLPTGSIAPTIWGAMTATDAMTINVQTAYSGALGLNWMPTQFSTQVSVWRSGSLVNLNMVINAKLTGARIYNGATQTWSGSLSGDTLPAFQAGDWLQGTFTSGPSLSRDVSGESNGPSIVWEIKADQGIS